MWKSLFTVGSICAAGLTLLALNKWKYYQLHFVYLPVFTLSLYLHWDQDYSFTILLDPCHPLLIKYMYVEVALHGIIFCVIEYTLLFSDLLCFSVSSSNNKALMVIFIVKTKRSCIMFVIFFWGHSYDSLCGLISPQVAVIPLKCVVRNLEQSQCRYKTIMSLCKHVHIFIFFSEGLLPSAMEEAMTWMVQVLF